MSSPDSNHPGAAQLRKQFPALYITLVSVVIALAIESLLGRLDEPPSFGTGWARAVLFTQVASLVMIAAMFWWISARWVSTIPWRFRFFDGLSQLLMLIGLHRMSIVGGVFGLELSRLVPRGRGGAGGRLAAELEEETQR